MSPRTIELTWAQVNSGGEHESQSNVTSERQSTGRGAKQIKLGIKY